MFFVKLQEGEQSANQKAEYSSKNWGCFISLIDLFLRPIPIIYACYQYDLKTAVIVALVMWPIFQVLRINSNRGASRDALLQISWIILPICAGLTIYFDETFYFQLTPTILFLFFVVDQVIGLARNTQFIQQNQDENYHFSAQEHRLIRWGLMGGGLVGMLSSEYLRHNLLPTSWIWYYGYLRFELVVLLLASMLPACIKFASRVKETNQ
ncbi:MAG: septation protein IspZ, partial [Pseudomonadota bacterium]